MDDKDTNRNETVERSAEEIAWDEEFNGTKGNTDFASILGDLAALAVKIPVAVIQMPVNMLPDETRRHARAALRESFLAVRSLLGVMGDNIESMLTEQDATGDSGDTAGTGGTVSGPPGTWGTARQGQSSQAGTTGTPTVRRIEVEESDENTEPHENRGLRADIDY